MFDILIEDDAQTAVAVFAMSEPDIELAAVQPWVSFCNDSSGTSPEGLLGKEFPHPRAYGTFPRVLRKYVREERRMRLEEAIAKFTSLPASRLRLADRGVIKAGMWADIVVFDPQTITDRATFSAAQPALGRHAVGAGERCARRRRRSIHGLKAGPRAARWGNSALNSPRGRVCAPLHPCRGSLGL